MTDDHRKNRRCSGSAPISFGFVNQDARYLGIAKNVCREGMFFVTGRPLALGATITIKPLDCRSSQGDDQMETGAPQEFCKDRPQDDGEPCFRVNSLVTATVKHCKRIRFKAPMEYGVGVHYMGPAV
jgi:hypothetical protein